MNKEDPAYGNTIAMLVEKLGYSRYHIASWIKIHTPVEIIELAQKNKTVVELYRNGLTMAAISIETGVPEGMGWKMIHAAGMSAMNRRKKAYGKCIELNGAEDLDGDQDGYQEGLADKEIWYKKRRENYKEKLDNEILNSCGLIGCTEQEYRAWINTKWGECYCFTVQGHPLEGEFLGLENNRKRILDDIRREAIEEITGDAISERDRELERDRDIERDRWLELEWLELER